MNQEQLNYILINSGRPEPQEPPPVPEPEPCEPSSPPPEPDTGREIFNNPLPDAIEPPEDWDRE